MYNLLLSLNVSYACYTKVNTFFFDFSKSPSVRSNWGVSLNIRREEKLKIIEITLH